MNVDIEEKCSFLDCSSWSEYGCSCNDEIYLCSSHYNDHASSQGIHNKIVIAELKAKISSIAKASLFVLQENQNQLLKTEKTLIQKIANSTKEIFCEIRIKKNNIKNLANNKYLKKDVEKRISENMNIKYKINDELKASLLYYLEMSNDSYSQYMQTKYDHIIDKLKKELEEENQLNKKLMESCEIEMKIYKKEIQRINELNEKEIQRINEFNKVVVQNIKELNGKEILRINELKEKEIQTLTDTLNNSHVGTCCCAFILCIIITSLVWSASNCVVIH